MNKVSQFKTIATLHSSSKKIPFEESNTMKH